ncbi:MAG: hypothetical protein Q4G16_07490 [Cruoricaptor ignavus]|nr:hypothetical protein [Cruoricaptor ignavus]
MRKETSIIIAGAFGVLTTLGFFFLKKFVCSKKHSCYYDDFHSQFNETEKQEEHHGVEYLAMK